MPEKNTHTLEPRIDLKSPGVAEIMKAMYGLETPLRNTSLEPGCAS